MPRWLRHSLSLTAVLATTAAVSALCMASASEQPARVLDRTASSAAGTHRSKRRSSPANSRRRGSPGAPAPSGDPRGLHPPPADDRPSHRPGRRVRRASADRPCAEAGQRAAGPAPPQDPSRTHEAEPTSGGADAKLRAGARSSPRRRGHPLAAVPPRSQRHLAWCRRPGRLARPPTPRTDAASRTRTRAQIGTGTGTSPRTCAGSQT